MVSLTRSIISSLVLSLSLPPPLKQLDHYGGIFECFYPGKGCERTIIMAGTFTVDNIFDIVEKIKKDFVEQFIKNGRMNSRVGYFGSRFL